MQRRIAIVGANGFVGRNLLSHAVSQGVDVMGVVRSEKGADVVRQLGGQPSLVPDLGAESTRALPGALEGCSGLVYTASVSAGAKSADRTDPEGVRNVLEACRRASVPRVVFFSGLGIARYGVNVHCTNPYFLAKMAGEVELFRSSLAAFVFRPSYIFGPGDEFLAPLMRRAVGSTEVEIPGDGAYRLQPISVRDTARAILAALGSAQTSPRVVDLVGPEVVSYRDLIGRLGPILNRSLAIRERPLDEALALARRSSYFGLKAHDLACLLCDEVADPGPVEGLVGAPLESLELMMAQARDALSPTGAK